MNIKFWGVRGSLPSPLVSKQIREKIDEVIQLASPQDLLTEESKRRFIEALPESLYGTTGGNTPCVELTSDDNQKIIFDAGTGIRVLGKEGETPESLHYSLFFSHFHWDHIQGFPFFDPIYSPKVKFDVYSPFVDMKNYLSGQMSYPYYPVLFDCLADRLSFHIIEESKEFEIGSIKMNCKKMSHPGNSYSYSVTQNGKKFVYATDVELSAKNFDKISDESELFMNADVLVFDSQYTVEEAILKENWGHSAFCYAIDFAALCNIKRLFFFHHEPTYDDNKLSRILDAARWYSMFAAKGNVDVNLASEGLKIEL